MSSTARNAAKLIGWDFDGKEVRHNDRIFEEGNPASIGHVTGLGNMILLRFDDQEKHGGPFLLNTNEFRSIGLTVNPKAAPT